MPSVNHTPFRSEHQVFARSDLRLWTSSTRLAWRVATHLSVFLLGAAFSVICYAGTLSGEVVDRNNQPKAFVSIDVLGPGTVYTETDEKGQFNVTLPPGAYVIRVRDGNRRMEFSREVGDTPTSETFTLRW